jgi:general secretion pathway protein A
LQRRQLHGASLAPEKTAFTAEPSQPLATAPSPAVELPAVVSTPPATTEPPDVQPTEHTTEPTGEHTAIALLAAVSMPPATPSSFFGLKADAFCTHPEAQFFYPSPQHREALAILFHRIRSNTGFLVLLGEPGTGKSIVLECLRDLLKTQATHFAVLINSKISVAEFFELIAHDFRLPRAGASKTATLIALNEYLLERSRNGQATALVVDSAEKLSTEVLEEIELLGNLENRDGRLLQVVFAAQPGFERRLDVPQLRGLKQRLMFRARLEPLDAIETAAYIEHRMAAAGLRNQSVFPRQVIAEIHRRTHGVPRAINALCGLVLGSCQELKVKTAEMGMLERITGDFTLDAPVQS